MIRETRMAIATIFQRFDLVRMGDLAYRSRLVRTVTGDHQTRRILHLHISEEQETGLYSHLLDVSCAIPRFQFHSVLT